MRVPINEDFQSVKIATFGQSELLADVTIRGYADVTLAVKPDLDCVAFNLRVLAFYLGEDEFTLRCEPISMSQIHSQDRANIESALEDICLERNRMDNPVFGEARA